jgi:tetratricopeptide (TPR) repeat protein
LIVTLSRRKNDLDGAEVYVQKAYAELEAYSGENKIILLAWVLNVYSYMLMKRKDLNGAIQKHESAYYLLAEHFFPPNLVALDEVNFTKAILAENLAILNAQAGNFEKVQNWYAIETTLTNLWPSLIVVSSAEWQSFYYQQLKLSLALAHSVQGIERCKESFNYILEYFFTLSVAEIQNKMGNAFVAIEFYKRCLIFHDRIGNSYSQISFFELNMALIRVTVYAGNYSQAIDLIKDLEQSKTNVSNIERIAICEQYAMAYAYLGNADDAEKQVNFAIDIGVTEGDCNLMFKAILVAAKVCQILNRFEDATDAYLQALEVSKTIIDGQSFVASNTDLMFLYLGLLESGDAIDKDFYSSLLNAVAKALKEDSESWWNLSRFLKHLHHLPAIESDLIKQFNPTAYSKILEAGFERSDCKTYLEFNKNELQINLN